MDFDSGRKIMDSEIVRRMRDSEIDGRMLDSEISCCLMFDYEIHKRVVDLYVDRSRCCIQRFVENCFIQRLVKRYCILRIACK